MYPIKIWGEGTAPPCVPRTAYGCLSPFLTKTLNFLQEIYSVAPKFYNFVLLDPTVFRPPSFRSPAAQSKHLWQLLWFVHDVVFLLHFISFSEPFVFYYGSLIDYIGLSLRLIIETFLSQNLDVLQFIFFSCPLQAVLCPSLRCTLRLSFLFPHISPRAMSHRRVVMDG